TMVTPSFEKLCKENQEQTKPIELEFLLLYRTEAYHLRTLGAKPEAHDEETNK
ncbi:hypothetical protein PIB30_036140, partial [Stylosanthes scabra]|nr:hypothetical protein [Stylosanthes scabra]